MSSRFKHEISIRFNSDDKSSANEILCMFLKELEVKNINLKALRCTTITSKTDLKDKGNELLDNLNIKVEEVSSNEDILKSDNFSAILSDKRNNILK